MLETKNFDVFFEKKENMEKSLIFKQLKKLRDKDFWKDKMNKYLKFILLEKDTKQLITFFTKFRDFLVSDFIIELSKIDDNEYYSDEFYNIYTEEEKIYFMEQLRGNIGYDLEHFNCIFMDIYYVLRTFKEKHSLSIGYFGNLHVTNLTYFFTNILNEYTLKNEIALTDDKNRCLDFSNEKINLDELISSYS